MPELNDITPDPEDATAEAPEAEDIEVLAHSADEELPCAGNCGSFHID